MKKLVTQKLLKDIRNGGFWYTIGSQDLPHLPVFMEIIRLALLGLKRKE